MLFSYRRIRADGEGDSTAGYKIGSIEYIPEVSTDLVNWLSGPEYLEEAGDPVDNGDGSENATLRTRNLGSAAQFFRVRIVRD